MPTYLDDLPTPALLIERERLLGNIDRMQSLAEREGVNLRPHTKTHKSVEIARIQRSRGARGITVAKTSEAEVFAEAGFDDIRIASTVFGTDKWERIARLAKNINISFCIDSAAAVEGASKVFEASGLVVDVLMEVDPGYHRCGVDPDTDEAIEIARMITKAKGLRLTGLLTHAGQGYYGPSNGESRAEALRIASEEERDSMLLRKRRYLQKPASMISGSRAPYSGRISGSESRASQRISISHSASIRQPRSKAPQRCSRHLAW